MAKAKKVTVQGPAHDMIIPLIKSGAKIKGTVLKEIDQGVLVECAEGAFTGIILIGLVFATFISDLPIIEIHKT